MAVNSIISRICDLTKPIVVDTLGRVFSMGDRSGDQFNIAVYNATQPTDLSTASVNGYFIRIPPGKMISEGETVLINGLATSNIVTLTLPESCYVEPCRFILTIKVTIGDVRHAIYVGEGAVLRSTTDDIIDPGHEIPSLEDLFAQISRMEAAAAQVDAAVNSATSAASAANTAANSLRNMTAIGHRVPQGEDPVVSVGTVDGHYQLDFGLPEGPQGPKGDRGEKGDTGPEGPQGSPGPTGPEGPKGETGDQGLQGPPGPTGDPGPKGDRGDVGPEGPRGLQGDPGPKGDNGTTPHIDISSGNWFVGEDDTGVHAQGPKGEPGDTGPQGLQGPQGEPGPTGEKGPKGDKGEPGSIGNIVVKAHKVEAGGDPTATKEETEGHINIDFGIPEGLQGQPGPKGDQGLPGESGVNGKDGVTPHIDNNTGNWFIGDKDTNVKAQGPKGDEGSAGPTGPAGPQGPQGLQGADGAPGAPGERGPEGPKGSDGVTPHIDEESGNWFLGETDTGVKAKGEDGIPGLNGMNGEPGTPGKDGKNGATFTPSVSPEGMLSWANDQELPNPESVSIRGPKGDKGEPGPTGEKGPKGDKGEPGTIADIPYSDEGPKPLGVAAPGVSEEVSRADHVHPLPEIGGTNILRNTNSEKLNPTTYHVDKDAWKNSRWSKLGATDNNITVFEVNDAPNPEIKYGVRFTAKNGVNLIATQQGIIPFAENEKYVTSCYARSKNGGKLRIENVFRESNGIVIDNAHYNKEFQTTTEWKRYYKVVSKTKDSGKEEFIQICFVLFDASEETELEVCGLKFEKGEVPTSWSPAPEDKQDKIDLIGGRNLLRGTNEYKMGTGYWSDSSWRQPSGGTGTIKSVKIEDLSTYGDIYGYEIDCTKGNYDIAQERMPFIIGNTYTFSFYAKVIEKTPQLIIRATCWSASNRQSSLMEQLISYTDDMTQWKKYVFHFTVPADENINRMMVQSGIHGDGGIGKVQFCRLKLEVGEVATDWSPAPEDTMFDISSRNLLKNSNFASEDYSNMVFSGQMQYEITLIDSVRTMKLTLGSAQESFWIWRKLDDIKEEINKTPGKFYTASAKVYVEETTKFEFRFTFRKDSAIVKGSNSQYTLDKGWHTVYSTCPVPEEDFNEVWIIIVDPNAVDQKVYVAWTQIVPSKAVVDWSPAPEDLVPTSRTINGKALNNNITLTTKDLGIKTQMVSVLGSQLTDKGTYFIKEEKVDIGFNDHAMIIPEMSSVANDDISEYCKFYPMLYRHALGYAQIILRKLGDSVTVPSKGLSYVIVTWA